MSQSHDAARFDESFGALKRCINTLVSQAYTEAELGPTQVRVLRHIGKHAPISQAEISRAIATDPALTGRALKTLIDRGWVLRERCVEDRREYVLKLGAAGQRALKRVEALRAHLVERIVAPLDERDLADFQRIAGKLLAAFGPSAAASSADRRLCGPRL